MRRREFIAGLAGVATWPITMRAQQPERMRCSALLTLLSISAVPQEAARADAASGQLLFNNACRTCHTMKEGDNRLGPNLHNIIGRKAGSLPDYGYSSAMKGADFVGIRRRSKDLSRTPMRSCPAIV